jgi:hypothetical protein
MRGMLERRREFAEWDLGRPHGAERRDYLRFRWAVLVCIVRGHRQPKMLHRYEPIGSKGRMMVRQACDRCGFPLDEKRSKVIQFPRPRGGGEAWRKSQ